MPFMAILQIGALHWAGKYNLPTKHVFFLTNTYKFQLHKPTIMKLYMITKIGYVTWILKVQDWDLGVKSRHGLVVMQMLICETYKSWENQSQQQRRLCRQIILPRARRLWARDPWVMNLKLQ